MAATETKTKKVWKVVNELKPAMAMVMVVTALAAATVLYKLAIDDGMNFAVVNAYRYMFASSFMVPLAFLHERKNIKGLTFRAFYMNFFCGLFGGSVFQNLYLESLVLTTATFVSASFNLIPAITFVLAITFGLEKLNWGAAAGKAKMIGTITGIGGAMVMTFVKGVEINIWSSSLRRHHNAHAAHQNASVGQRIAGVVCALASCVSFSVWIIIQGKMSENAKKYPSHRANTALMCTMAAIQSTVFALCFERDWSQWKLGWNIRLLTVVYSGIVASGFMVIAIAWCVEKRGPLFTVIFNPLMLLLVALASSLVLDEQLYLGSVLGGVLVVFGLYMVIWGKGKEAKARTRPELPLPLQQISQEPQVVDTPKNQEHEEPSKDKQENPVSSNV